MIASFGPIETYAMVGALTEVPAWPKNPSGIHEGIYNKYQVHWMENQYIRMYWLTGTDEVKDKNIYLVTVPARTEASAKEAYDMVFTKGVYQRPYFMANSKEITYDSWSIQTANDNTWIEISYVFKPYTQIKKLSRKNTYTVKTKYYIVGLDEGMSSGFSEAGTVIDDKSDEGTYGIRCEMSAGYAEGSGGGYSDELSLSFDTQMVGFDRMGHENVSTGPGMYMSTATGSSAEGYTHTTEGIGADFNHIATNDLSWWSTPSTGMNSKGTAITEILTKGYSWANPFTALSELYSAYVDGHYIDQTYPVDSLPGYFSATRSGNVTLETPLPLMGKQRTEIHGSTLWGFRDLRAMDDPDFTPADNFTPVSVSAKGLGIFKDGSDDYKAIPIESDSAYDLAVKLNGEPVSVMRGNFEEKDNRYVFSSPAALSTSVTAVWSSTGSFSVGKDGSVELSGVNLNAPTFKFYQNKAGKNGLSIEPSEEGLLANIDSSANSAVIAIDIPGTKVQLEEAVIKMNGDLGFRGNAEFSLLPGAEFNMEELRFGYGKEVQGRREFKVNGIRAEIPEEKPVSTEMLGFEMGEFRGTIDTIKSNPEYSFNLMLNVYDLFEASAELMLTKFEKTGNLMPDTLIFDMKSNVGGIKLVAPVVVMEITGGGGGFSGLAKTLNGDFFAIPPIKLIASGSGEVMKTIEGTVRYTFGPAYFKSEFSDIEIFKKIKLIDSFYIYEGIQGEQRTYNKKEYTGLSAIGGAGVHVSVPHQYKVFQAGGSVDASVFGGLDSYTNPSEVYIVADLNGNVNGSVHVPEDVPLIGGEKIASTSLAFYLGASSVVDVDVSGKDPKDMVEAAAESAFKNFRVYGGVMKEDDWGIAAWRGYYIFPENDAGFTVKPFWKELPEWNWEDHISSGYSVYTSEEDDALGFMIVSMEPLEASVTETEENSGTVVVETEENSGTAAVEIEENSGTAAVEIEENSGSAMLSDYSYDVTLEANAGQTLPSDARVLLMVTPADGTDIDAFAKSLTVTPKNGSPIALTWPEYNENGEIINESAINAMVTTNGEGKDCVMIGLGENASVRDSWTVTSSLADFNASLNASMPFDSLNIRLNDYTLSGNVANAAADADYVLATYFGSEKGKSEYVISYEDIEDPTEISVEIPKEGTMLPTGNYYVTASLLNKVTVEIEDEEGNTTEEEVMLPVDTVEFDSVSYTNTAQPDAPSSVTITPVGNEIMEASWSEVTGADGYKVTIYQEQDGSYVDTERGYAYDAADIKAGKIKGITYDDKNDTFKLDMALTVGGEDLTGRGNSEGLEANKNYRIGVQAYKYLTENGEKIENSQVYSEETLSNDANLPKYDPVDINVVLKTSKGGSYVDHTVTEEDGVFTCVTGGGDDNTWYLTPSVPEGTNATFTVTRMDTNDTYLPDNYTGECSVDNEEIIGSVMFKIDAAVNTGTYTDTTTKYLLVQKDDTAPMLSLDESMVYADPNTGEYTITGLTEPKGKVCLNGDHGNAIEAATADENGRFSYTGKLELTTEILVYDDEGNLQVDEKGEPIMETVPNESSKLVSLLAKDENGNQSALESTIVTVKQEENPSYPVTCAHTGGTATCTEKAKCKICGASYGELDSTNHNLEKVPAKDATVTETGNIEYWHCKDCGKYFSDENGKNSIELKDTVIAKLPPEIIEGKGQSVTEGEKKALSFTSNAAFDDLIRVELDGKTLDEKNYTVKEGSTVVTLKADYTATLSVGKHTIGVVSESGTATTTFTVNVRVNAWDKTVLRSQATASKTSIKMKWNAVPEADGYVIYWNRCGAKNAFKQIKVIKSGKTLTWTHKGLKKGSLNKYYVKAYKMVGNKKQFIKTSNRIHLVTEGGKYTNVKKLQSSVSSITLKKGKTKALKITQTYVEKNKKLVTHMKTLIYTTSNKKVATVTSQGVIKAEGKGSCYIYITASSGVYTRVKVVVK